MRYKLAHARAEGVEDPYDARLQAVEAMVGHGHCFGKPFGFIIDSIELST